MNVFEADPAQLGANEVPQVDLYLPARSREPVRSQKVTSVINNLENFI